MVFNLAACFLLECVQEISIFNTADLQQKKIQFFFANKRTWGGGSIIAPPIISARRGQKWLPFFRDEIFCKKVKVFWLQLPELQGAPKIGLFQADIFFGFNSKKKWPLRKLNFCGFLLRIQIGGGGSMIKMLLRIVEKSL